MSDETVDYAQVSDHEKEINKGDHVKVEPEAVERGEDFVWTNENAVASGRSFQVPGNDVSGYVGVGPEYRNYGDPNLKPLLTEAEREQLHDGGWFTDTELEHAGRNANGSVVMATNPSAGSESEESEADKDDKDAVDPEETDEERAAREDRERGADGRFLPKAPASGVDQPKL